MRASDLVAPPAGAKLLFLPKYSLDLDPIQQVFAKLKHLLRKAAAHTQRAVSLAIGNLLDSYPAADWQLPDVHSGRAMASLR